MISSLLSNFLKKANKPPVIAIVGPTGAGKSQLSIEIAKEVNGEIINADSKQLYKGLKITTGVIKDEEKEGIPHHLFSYIEPEIIFTVEDHRKDALLKIEEILSKKKIPILVGGTGLFINALTQNFDIPKNSMNWELKKELDKKSSDELWNELNKIDPEYAKITHKNNRVIVIRALEFFYMTNQKKSKVDKGEEKFSVLILMPKIKDREELYEHINKRAEYIWKNGLLDEAKVLFDKRLDEKLPALKSIGIPEAFSFFRKEISEEEAIEQMQQKSRNYAKRQMTWWRNDERVKIV